LRLVPAAVVVFAAVFPATANAADYCSKRELRARGTTTIMLDPAGHEVRKQFGFYLAGPFQKFVLFFKPDDVLALVEMRAGDNRDFQEVLNAMRGDLPLERDTDLFKYALLNRAWNVDMQYLVASLLDSGKVFVDLGMIHRSGATPPDPNDAYDPISIKRVNWEMRGANGRTYCTDIGLTLLQVTDTIYD